MYVVELTDMRLIQQLSYNTDTAQQQVNNSLSKLAWEDFCCKTAHKLRSLMC